MAVTMAVNASINLTVSVLYCLITITVGELNVFGD